MVSTSEVLDIAQRNVFNLDPMPRKQVLELVQLLGGEDTRKAAEDMIVQTTPGLSIRIERVAAILSRDRPAPLPVSQMSLSTTSSGTPSTASNALIPGWRAEERKKDVVTIDLDSDSDWGSEEHPMRRPRSLTDETKNKNKNKTDSVDTQPPRRKLRPRLTQPLQGVEDVIEDNTEPGLSPTATGLLKKKKKRQGGRALSTAERQECLMHAWDTPDFHKPCQFATFA